MKIRLPFTLRRTGHLEIKCCGKWVAYPTLTSNTRCPECGTIFSIRQDDSER